MFTSGHWALKQVWNRKKLCNCFVILGTQLASTSMRKACLPQRRYNVQSPQQCHPGSPLSPKSFLTSPSLPLLRWACGGIQEFLGGLSLPAKDFIRLDQQVIYPAESGLGKTYLPPESTDSLPRKANKYFSAESPIMFFLWVLFSRILSDSKMDILDNLSEWARRMLNPNTKYRHSWKEIDSILSR